MASRTAPGPKTVQKRTPGTRGPRKPHRKPWIMSREECAIIKSLPNTGCATGQRNRAMLELMHRVGLRVGEVCGLLTRDILGLDETQPVAPSLSVIGKGNKERKASVDPQTIHWMRRWHDTRQGRRLTGRTFFVTLKGTPVSTRYAQQLVRCLADRAVRRGMISADRAARITPHKFRHAFATEMLEEGKNLAGVGDHLGHANIATTAIYVHARDGALAKDMAERPPDLPLEEGA